MYPNKSAATVEATAAKTLPGICTTNNNNSCSYDYGGTSDGISEDNNKVDKNSRISSSQDSNNSKDSTNNTQLQVSWIIFL
jgi:hypothetical protein